MEVEMGNFVLQLPVEITADILSRLPVSSVIRSKLVCKTWRSLVQDPVFLDIYTSLLLLKQAAAAAMTTNTNFYLLVQQFDQHCPTSIQKHYFGEVNNHEMSNSSSSHCFKLSKPLNSAKDDDDVRFSNWRYHWRRPIGSSNGLICSYSIRRDTIYVYNPCTRESVRLPPPLFIPTQFTVVISSGFGYDPLRNEYKVVLILCNHDEEGKSLPGAEVCVYTLGSGKWRTNKLESWINLNMSLISKPNVSFSKPGVFFNGALHWIAWELININHFDILSFHLANEEFRIIVPSPPLMSTRIYYNPFSVQLGLWGGCCLCLSQWNLDTETTEIWMLMINSKDNKDIKSWTMKFKIPATTTDWTEKKLDYCYHPVALLGRDKILLKTYKGNEPVFVSYDSETGNFEDEVIDYSELQTSKSRWSYCSVIPYTKSLVSLKPFGEEDAGLSF